MTNEYNPFTDENIKLATSILQKAEVQQTLIATAESCTGGLISAIFTNIAGSSAAFDRSVVTYSNQAKREMLGVPKMTLARHGAVSEETAHAMAQGLCTQMIESYTQSLMVVSVTGIAGPGGGSIEKPVGTVCFGFAHRKSEQMTPSSSPSIITSSKTKYFKDLGRDYVRQQTILTGLQILNDHLG